MDLKVFVALSATSSMVAKQFVRRLWKSQRVHQMFERLLTITAQ
jgi:hypothetical protein